MITTGARKVRSWNIFLLVSLYLAASGFWAVVTPGDEWPAEPWHYVAMALDAGLILALFSIRASVKQQMPPDDPRRRQLVFLFWLGLAGGAALILVRFTSEAAWRTGHLTSGL